MQTIKTNDIKKGTHITFKDGRVGVVMDNMRGNIRLVSVAGPFQEMGSVYVWEWKAAQINNVWIPIELTPAQQEAFELVSSFLY